MAFLRPLIHVVQLHNQEKLRLGLLVWAMMIYAGKAFYQPVLK